MADNKLSALVSSWFPEFVRENGPNLVAFFEAWVEWMEEERGIVTAHLKALDRKDIDRTLDEFVDFFHAEFMNSIPRNVLADRRLLIKHIQRFYRAKGSQKAIRFLFRVLFNEEVEFYYPARDILKCSGARWVIDREIRCTSYVSQTQLDTLIGKVITGSHTGAQGRVESIITRIEPQIVGPSTQYVTVSVIQLSNVTKPFSSDDTISNAGTTYAKVLNYVVHPGRYDGTFGFLSSDKYLQGPHYYQEYSYVIKSAQSVKFYADIVKQLVHPAGVRMFGQVSSVSYTDALTMDVFDTGTLVQFEPISVELVPVVETTIGFTDTSSAAIIFQIVGENDDLVHELTKMSRLINATGTLDTANITDFSQITDLSKFGGWTVENFNDGKGLIGTGTNLFTVVRPGDTIILTNGVTDYTGVCVSVDSNETMRIAPAHPNHPATGLTLQVYTSFPFDIRSRFNDQITARSGEKIVGRGEV